MRIRSFAPADRRDVIALWEACGLLRPWNDPERDIDRKLARDPELLLVGVDEGGAIVGSVMAGYDGHRGWINFLAVTPTRRGGGHGRALVEEAERRLVALGCPKVQLQVRIDNADAVGFYEALGYERADVIDLGKRLIADAPAT